MGSTLVPITKHCSTLVSNVTGAVIISLTTKTSQIFISQILPKKTFSNLCSSRLLFVQINPYLIQNSIYDYNN